MPPAASAARSRATAAVARSGHATPVRLAASTPRGRVISVDLNDEASIAAALTQHGPIDHIVSAASASASGPVTALELPAIEKAIAAKLTGPLLLAKHGAPRLPVHGTLTFLSDVVAWRPGADQAVTAMTNGALAHLGAALAVELASRRVNIISPGIVDSGLWDTRADGDAFLEKAAAANPARRVGDCKGIADAVLFAITNPFTTGSVTHVDRGG